jgi:hypothetical protein
MTTLVGALVVEGIEIGPNGIIRGGGKSESTPMNGGVAGFGNLLPMSDRLVFLSKIGQGATSVVYRALDLKVMKLVAVKMLTIKDRYAFFLLLSLNRSIVMLFL